MKILLIACLLFLATGSDSIYDFKVEGIDGKEINFEKFKGKKILIVNVASYCGYTRQYDGLEQLYNKYKDELVVIGFPANNFGNQEPDSDEKIMQFCRKDKGVSFPLSKKVSVKGDDIHPLFSWLDAEANKLNIPDPVIKWNFTKFLIDEKGKLVEVFPSKVEPLSDDITRYFSKS